jgi:hypothetical protein
MRGFSFSKIRAGLRAGYQLWGSSSEKADIHRKNDYCVDFYSVHVIIDPEVCLRGLMTFFTRLEFFPVHCAGTEKSFLA